jgi:membrane AbrB-like protein
MFTTDVLNFMISSWLAVVIAIGGAVVAGVMCGRIFLNHSGLDPVTALYATTVGGAAEMSGLAERNGGDGRLVAMYHSLRIALVVLLIPLGSALFYAGPTGATATIVQENLPHPLTALKLLAVSFVGAALALRFRLPGGILLGVILTVAFVNLALVELPQLPRELRYLAQLLIGASIGCTFDLEAIRRIQQLLFLKLKIIVLVIGLSLIWAVLLWMMTPLDPLTAVLSAAPGGAADMTAAAIALGANAPVVAAIQSLRVIVITLLMPFLIRQAIHKTLKTL